MALFVTPLLRLFLGAFFSPFLCRLPLINRITCSKRQGGLAARTGSFSCSSSSILIVFGRCNSFAFHFPPPMQPSQESV
jgi:hypothetical protein